MSEKSTEPGQPFNELIVTYELALRDKDPSDWYDATVTVIDSVQRHCGSRGLAESSVPKSIREHWYTRLAAALTQFIVADSTALNLEQLSAVCKRKQTIAYIFNASGYRHMKHLIPLIGSHQENGAVTLPAQRTVVLFAFVGVDDLPNELLALALKQPPDILLTLMLGWLNQRAILTEQGERNRTTLLQAGRLIETATISDKQIEQIVNAWMYSTYACTPKKHDIKQSFNVLLSGLLARSGLIANSTKRPRSARPTIVVVHERFIAQHAMYRCYAPSLRLLRKKFRLVSISEKKWIDDAADEIFDEIHTLEEGTIKLSSVIRLVESISPDIVYYPSLGMAHWTVMLAQLRLAPIQLMTHCHPGTSHSPAIDYVYVCELEGDLAALHSERVLVGSKYGAFEAHSNLPVELPPLISPSDREVRVAVNSKVMKLSHRLMDICEKLITNASVPVRFSFFPAERGLFFDGLSAAISARIPDATIAPYVDYTEFLSEMCRCDLALAAFPFGNTNSTVDTCLLGLPTVANFGPESPAQTDRMVLATAGFPEWLVARSDEEYYEKALHLINDSVFRTEILKDVSRMSAREKLFNMAQLHEQSDPFADMFWYVYENHEALQSSARRVIHSKDVLRDTT